MNSIISACMIVKEHFVVIVSTFLEIKNRNGITMQSKRIGIKYCGGCNPKINRGQVAEEVTEILESDGFLISYNRFDVDLIIYISGCLSNCAQKYNPCDLPNIVVADESVNFNTVNETRISQEIAQSVRDYFLSI